uniref:Uncharacterized protein n=1 Tax=Triticum aestivum TaxID=4565 RepID=A0A3B6PM92_WHEAT
MLADDLRCPNAFIGLGKCHPHRAFVAAALAATAFASTAVAETELDLASPSLSSSSSSSAAPPSLAEDFQNGAHPQTLAFRLPEAATEAIVAEEDAATDRERATRCSRSMRLCTRPTASPDAEEEEDGEAHVQGQGRTRAQLGQSRSSRSRRQYGHTPPPDLAAGCFRHRHSSPPTASAATAAFSAFIRAVALARPLSLSLCLALLGEWKEGGVTNTNSQRRCGKGRAGVCNKGGTGGA